MHNKTSKFLWCESGGRYFIDENNIHENIKATFNTYEEAKAFGKTRCPDDEDYGVFRIENGKLFIYSDAFGQPLQKRELYPNLNSNWEPV